MQRPSSHLNSDSEHSRGGQFSSSEKSSQSGTLSHFHLPGMHFLVELHLQFRVESKLKSWKNS